MRNVIAGGQGVPISTLTPLSGWVTITQQYELLLFWAKPLDQAASIAIHVESAEEDQPDTTPDDQAGDPGKQVSSEVGPPVVRRKYRLSAYSIGPGGTFPPTTINWGIVAATS